MTSIGHSIVGASFGVTSLPASASRRYKFLILFISILLANFPDIPVPNWSHEFYDFSHSLLVNLAMMAISAGVFLYVCRVRKTPEIRRLIIPFACAWLSHILLDTFYNHARGVAIFWPVSSTRLAVPIPWFSVLPMDPFQNLAKIFKIFMLEILSYGPLLVLSIRLHNWKKIKSWAGLAPIPIPVSDK